MAMIDWARVDELRTEIGEDDFAEIAGLFLEELAEATGGLATLRDPTALSDAYHGLKGAALNLGFSRLAELATAAEQDPSSADPGAISAVCQSSAKALLDRHPGIAS